MLDHRRRQNQRKRCCQSGKMSRLISCILASTISLLLFLLTMLIVNMGGFKGNGNNSDNQAWNWSAQWTYRDCFAPCKLSLVETVPYAANETNFSVDTSKSWINLISSARHTIDIVSYPWHLRSSPNSQGSAVFKQLVEASALRGIKTRILLNVKDTLTYYGEKPSDILKRDLAAQVLTFDFEKSLGYGFYPTKLIVVDGSMMYVGSADFDWGSLSLVKEIGIEIRSCTCMVNDLAKLFQFYWGYALSDTPITTRRIKYSNKPDMAVVAHIDAPPPVFCPTSQSVDYSQLATIIESATSFVYIMMMDFSPVAKYHSPDSIWNGIQPSLSKVGASREIDVRLIFGWLNSTHDQMRGLLKPVQKKVKNTSIQTRLLLMSAARRQSVAAAGTQSNPSMYIVTDNMLFIANSNWCSRNHAKFGGFSIALDYRDADIRQRPDRKLRDSLRLAFLRDWNVKFAKKLDQLLPTYSFPV